MQLDHRPFADDDAWPVSQLVQSAEELFHFFPKATFPLAPEVLTAEAHKRDNAIVALCGDTIVGYAHFREIRPRRFCTISNLIVAPAHRRKGVATYLVESMAQAAETRFGARFVRASCFSHNTPAYQLLHKLGFRPADMVLRRAPDEEMWLMVHMHRRTGC